MYTAQPAASMTVLCASRSLMATNEQDMRALLSPEIWKVVIGFLQPDPSNEDTAVGYLAR